MAEAVDSAGLPTDNKVGVILTAVIAMLAVTTAFVGVRLYVRLRITHSLWWDDWTMLMALLFTIVTGVDMCIMVRFGMGYHIWTLSAQQVFDYFFGFYLSIVFYNAGLGIIKISLLLQYYRIFSSKMRKLTVVAMVIIGMWCSALVMTSILSCTPVEGFWNHDIQAKCIPQLPQWYINAAGNIATDIFIFALPIPVLWKLKLPRSQRYSLLGVFGIGFFTCTISVIRISFLNLGTDTTYENVGPAAWSVGELCCGIVCSCLPTLRPIFIRWFPILGGGSRDNSSRAYRMAGNRVGTNAYVRGYGSNTVMSIHSGLSEDSKSAENLSSVSEEGRILSDVQTPRPPVPEKDYRASVIESEEKRPALQFPPAVLSQPRIASFSGRDAAGVPRNGVYTTIEGPSVPKWGPVDGIQVETETIIKNF